VESCNLERGCNYKRLDGLQQVILQGAASRPENAGVTKQYHIRSISSSPEPTKSDPEKMSQPDRPGHKPYTYSLRNREIRLVLIHPGKWTDPIQCSLTNHFLDEDALPKYSALSYAWGAASVTDPITLEDQPWQVSVGLSNALHFLQNTKDLIRMWIDAPVGQDY